MKKLITFLMLLTVFGAGNVWAESTANFTFESKWNANEKTIEPITATFGGTTSDQPGFRRFKRTATLDITATSDYTITGITVTFTTANGKELPTTGQITASPGTLSFDASAGTCTWTGEANEIVLSKDNTGNEFDITGISVTYDEASTKEYSYEIPIEDLRFEHLTYNPKRTGILGLDITTSGWQSNTITTTPYHYTLLLSNDGKTSNSLTIKNTSGAENITKVVLVGTSGDGTFASVTATGENTYNTTAQDQLVWMNADGASSATISFTATGQPQISSIYVFTKTPLTNTKQDVVLSFAPSTGSAEAGLTDHQIDGVVKATIGGTDNGRFRPDDFSASSVTNSSSNASFNQFHLSTYKVGVNTGSSAGTATVTATFAGNQYFNAATAGTYALTITAAGDAANKTISIDDMRISKTANVSGLNASNNNLDRTVGGFKFEHTGGEGVKFNNGDFLILRKSGDNAGTITITPVTSSGTVTINKVVINTMASYTTGTVTATGTDGNKDLNGYSSCTFDNVNASTFVLTAVSGEVYIHSYTIYYTESEANALDAAPVTPVVTFKKGGAAVTSDAVSNGDTYTSPVVETTPANFDISLSSNNTSVATVKTSNWTTAPLVSLLEEAGTATITASAAASTFFNAATDATYTVTYAETSDKWDFRTRNATNTVDNDKGWNDGTGWEFPEGTTEYYTNKFTSANRTDQSKYAPTTPSQLADLKFGRVNSAGLAAGQIRLNSTNLEFRHSAIWVDVPVTGGQSLILTYDYNKNSGEGGFDITGATVEGSGATSIKTGNTPTTVTLNVSSGVTSVRLQANTSQVRIYRIQVKNETRGTLDLRDSGSNKYEKNVGTGSTATTNNHFNHRVAYTPSDGAADPVTYANDASNFTITSSDPSVLDVSNAYVNESNFGNSSCFYFNNIIPQAAGTATLTVTFSGNNRYKPNSYTSTTYTVYGPAASFLVEAEDQQIQQGQFSTISPRITDASGNALGIKRMDDGTDRYTTYILDEEEATPDYSEYFVFTYTAGVGSGENYEKITVDASGKIETEDNDDIAAAVGAYRKITVSATPRAAYSTAFADAATAIEAEATITIIQKVANVQVDLYWDAACTETYKISTYNAETDTWSINPDYARQETDKQYVFDQNDFASGFPNGRMIYAKVRNEGDSIWFSYNQNDAAAVIPANPKLDKNKRIYEYRRGIPIYIDDDLSDGNSDFVTVNIVATAWDANTRKRNLDGSVARLMFPKIVNHIVHTRPEQPTYDPVSPDADAALNKDGRKIMNTSQNVVAYGTGASKSNSTGDGNLVYGKFSTGTQYTTEMLINENAVQQGIGSVPVVSTEVAKRRFTSVQIKVEGSGQEYISAQTYTEYWYLYDTDLRLYSDAEKTTPLQSVEIATNATTSAPSYKVTWYNKRNYDDPKNYNLGVTQEVDDYTGKITYSIGNTTADRSGATEATVDASTGVVTAGNKPGWVRVTATYTGGEQHGGQSGEPQYTSTTDKSETYFYVYILDPAQYKPTIIPRSCNFSGTMEYTVQAPKEWNVKYTTDGTDPSFTNGKEILKTKSETNEIGSDMAVGESVTVKAIAYNSDGTVTSAIVSETYTKKDAIPDPIFDPDGVSTPYRYNTSTLTVQIACARAGANIYYTVDGSKPVIGNANTYKYSGLSKVVISGNVTISAIAYDPEENMYSNIVPSIYKYSEEMDKPYFQVSDDGGTTWYGYIDASNWAQNGKSWYNGQEHDITPTTQIRIIDPNPVTGTIYYTLNDATPADNAASMIYAEGYPFTVGKTTTGKAITILEEAQSEVSSAKFNITGTNSNVWEAVDETLTDASDSGTRHGIHKDDGFVISTNTTLHVANTGTTVNKNSIKDEANSNGGTTSKMYAQAGITATFGGYDLASWEQMAIADAATGAPIDAVGTYSIKSISDTGIGNGNAKDEKKDNYNHIYSYKTDADKTKTGDVRAATTHEKTFKLPAIGDYVRFEPEQDGDLTVWVLQQGALLYEDDTYFIDNVLRIRPVYLVDEQGKSQKVKVVNNVPQLWSAARLSENWSKIQATAEANSWKDSKWEGPGNDDYNTTDAAYVQYIRVSDGALFNTVTEDASHHIISKLSEVPDDADDAVKATYYKRLVNKGPNKTETAAIYQMYKADLDKNHVNVGDPIKPFAIHTGATISLNDNRLKDDSDDGTGYVLASGGYAKYTFELKAGKTYFFFAQGSKIGIRGFQFVPTETGTRPEVSMDKEATDVTVDGATKTLDEAIAECANKTVNVTLSNRSFSTNWTTLVLPFSVSVAQIEKVFGANTDIVIFDDITGETKNTIHMTRHWHKMIVAGTPVLIKPTAAVDNPKFEGVQLEASAVDEITGSCDDFTMTGTFVKAEGALKPNDWYVNANGNFTYLKGDTNVDVNGSYSWLRKKDGMAARMLMTDMTSIIDEDGSETTGIIDIELPAGNGNVNILDFDTNVYSVNGQIVSQGSLKNLPKGVYIVNGKKVVIK